MTEFKIKLDTVDDVKRFVHIVNQYPYNVDLIAGRYVVDGRSIMGIFSLDLGQPLLARINCSPDDDLMAELASFGADD
jgi:phosphotransferase system HPr-like phosphotransfer protein